MSANWYKPFLYVGGVGVGNYYEFRDRMLGFSFEKSVTPSELTTWTMNVTLDNDDGAFTPRTTGTYANLNWFNQLVSLTPKTNPETSPGSEFYLYDFQPFSKFDEQFFVGIVDTFDIVDDGVNSRLELTVVDFMTIAARAASVGSLTNSSNQYQPDQIRQACSALTNNYFATTSALPVPPGFQSDAVVLSVQDVQYGANSYNTGAQLDLTDVDSTGNVADILASSVLPSQYCILMPARIDQQTTSPKFTFYECDYVGPSGIRSVRLSSAIRPSFEFVEGSATGSQIPFVSIDIGYRLDTLVNSVQVTNVTTSADLESFNATSIIENGSRNASYTALICTTTAEAQKQADRLVNRFSTPRYFPRSITTNYAAIVATGLTTVRDAITDLLQIDGLWLRCSVTYTPTGHSSSITDECIISGVRVEAVPGDMTVTFDLLPAVDYSSFILDSSTLGVLDTNRLG